MIQAVFEALHRSDDKPAFTVEAIVDYLEAHPEVRALNAMHVGKSWTQAHKDQLRTLPARRRRRRGGDVMSDFTGLVAQAQKVREHAIRMATNGGCFLGASLSCTDLIVYLYDRVLRVTPQTLADPERDYLLLSKGHDVPALYGTLAERGYFPLERLANHLSIDDHMYWHPNRAIPGVEFHSGLARPPAVGGHGHRAGHQAARRVRRACSSSLGDGELDEGSMWEAALVAGAKQLDNLMVIVDRNDFQANMRDRGADPAGAARRQVRGVRVRGRRRRRPRLPGAGARRSATLPRKAGKPTAIIARTVRGKGLPSLEDRADRWFVDLTADEVKMLLAELRGDAARPCSRRSRWWCDERDADVRRRAAGAGRGRRAGAGGHRREPGGDPQPAAEARAGASSTSASASRR